MSISFARVTVLSTLALLADGSGGAHAAGPVAPEDADRPEILDMGPEATIESFSAALRRGDAHALGERFDPDELRMAQIALSEVVSMADQRCGGFDPANPSGRDTRAELPRILVEEILIHTFESKETIEHGLRILGSVPDGPDRVHFVVRGLRQGEELSILTVHRVGDGWAVSMPPDVERGLGTMMELFQRVREAIPQADPRVSKGEASGTERAAGTAGAGPRSSMEGAIRISGDVVPPTLVQKVNAEYPQEARQARVQGKVVLQVVVDERGHVADIELVRGIESGARALDEAAMDAVRQWRYEPATLDGARVKVYLTVIVGYSLSE